MAEIKNINVILAINFNLRDCSCRNGYGDCASAILATHVLKHGIEYREWL